MAPRTLSLDITEACALVRAAGEETPAWLLTSKYTYPSPKRAASVTAVPSVSANTYAIAAGTR